MDTVEIYLSGSPLKFYFEIPCSFPAFSLFGRNFPLC